MRNQLTTILKPKRGALNDAAVARYKEATGRELTVAELRLLPFIAYTVTNEGYFWSNRVNDEEMQILRDLTDSGWILLERKQGQVGAFNLAVSDGYWNTLSRVLATTYVITAV